MKTYSRAEELGEDVGEAVERIKGQSGAVVGLGGWSGDINNGITGIETLRGKALGGVW